MSRLKDIETATSIKLALIANPHVGGLEISVNSVNGIVFLAGTVQTEEQRELVEAIARGHGGLDVKNEIEVLDYSPAEFFSRSENNLYKRSGLLEYEDKYIQSQIIGDMEADGRVMLPTLGVEVIDGVVRLSGYQPDDEARLRAEEIARRVPGVYNVENYITIRKTA